MRTTRRISLGSTAVGGGAPVSVQSMTKTDTRDASATLAQINELHQHGCDIIRVAIPDFEAAQALGEIVPHSPIPVIADIHFDHKLAIAAIETGAHAIRINPGNIGSRAKLAEIVQAAQAHHIPIRVGVNSGSLEADILREDGATPRGLVRSAHRHCRYFEELGFNCLKVSIKASSVAATVEANRLFAAETDYPLHLGITEAGSFLAGTIKSAVGIGTLLMEGIGDTIRVSLTSSPLDEIRVGIKILEAAGLRKAQPEIVSCPTCGRTQIDMQPIVAAVEAEVEKLKQQGYRLPLSKIAIMGCIVNGPGEARDADLGIAGGKGKGALFKDGNIIMTLPEDQLIPALLAELRAHAVKP